MGVAAGLAVSHYLGLNPSERRSLFQAVRDLHQLRSDVFHAKTHKRDPQFESKVSKTGNLLRWSIRKRLEEF